MKYLLLTGMILILGFLVYSTSSARSPITLDKSFNASSTSSFVSSDKLIAEQAIYSDARMTALEDRISVLERIIFSR